MMITRRDRLPVQARSGTGRVYAPDLLPCQQALLADLADLEFAYKKTFEAIRRGPGADVRKQEMISKLRQAYEARRAPYVRDLMAWQRQLRVDVLR